MFNQSLPEFFEFWTDTAQVTAFAIEQSGNSYFTVDGVPTLFPASDQIIRLSLNNPQNYDLNVSVSFPVSATENTDYAVTKDSGTSVQITLKQGFLEKGKGNDISPAVRLTEPRSGRNFGPFTVPVWVNSAETAIENFGDGEHDIVVTGAVDDETISDIARGLTNLQSNPQSINAKVRLDLARTTGLTSIGTGAFFFCTALTSITMPEGVTNIGASAFSGCSGLTTVDIPTSVTSIGDQAFSECTGLISMTMPNSVRSIGFGAFFSCTALTTVDIPSSVTSIGSYAFYDCTSLTSVRFANPRGWKRDGNDVDLTDEWTNAKNLKTDDAWGSSTLTRGNN